MLDHVGADEGANGVIAGVLDPSELVPIFQRQAGRVSPTLCGSAFDGVADEIANPTMVAPPLPVVNPCADAGAD